MRLRFVLIRLTFMMINSLLRAPKVIAVAIWFILVECTGLAQTGIDTNLIRQLVDSGMSLRLSEPDKSLIIGKRALVLSGTDYYFGELNSLQIIGESQYQLGATDSSLFYYRLALDVSKREEDRAESGNNLTSIATIFLDKGDLDSSRLYYQTAVDLFEDIRDSAQ